MRHLLLALLGAFGFALYLHGSARSTEAVDWGFDASGAGWNVQGATFSTSAAPLDGVGAGRLVATTAGQPIRLRSAYWLVPTVPGAKVSVKLWLRGDGDDFTSVSAELQAFGVSGSRIDAAGLVLSSAALTAAYTPRSVVSAEMPGGTAFLGVVVTAEPRRAGAELHIDSVVLTEIRPDPTSTATASATATATVTATSTATATATSTVTVTSTATATRSPTPVPTPAVFGVLTNGNFEDARGLYGWTAQGGKADAGSAFISASRAALLTSNSSSTKWVYQTVTVTSGHWYAAGAQLGALATDDEAWLRLAWYASTDGSGSQLEVVDSPVAPSGGGAVTTGPARAPANARSARVRLMLRPASGGFTMLAADDVTLASVAAPPPSATSSPTAAPLASATAPPSSAANGSSTTPTAAPGQRASSSPPSETGATGRIANEPVEARTTAPAVMRVRAGEGVLLRITELLPDPPQEGLDSEYEWVEVANLGAAPAGLAGFSLQDNVAVVALPDLTLVPGGVVVVGAPRADAASAVLVHLLTGLIGNGLGNGGDRLALLTPGGDVLDAVSWGSDRTYAGGALEVPAPGPGRSLLRRFTDDGSLVTVERLDAPTPGRADDALVRLGEAHLSAVPGTQGRGWFVLLLAAGAGLAWTVVRRARELRDGLSD